MMCLMPHWTDTFRYQSVCCYGQYHMVKSNEKWQNTDKTCIRKQNDVLCVYTCTCVLYKIG